LETHDDCPLCRDKWSERISAIVQPLDGALPTNPLQPSATGLIGGSAALLASGIASAASGQPRDMRLMMGSQGVPPGAN
jgi:hypothetical protein